MMFQVLFTTHWSYYLPWSSSLIPAISQPRTLAMLSDAYDEHLHLVRIADSEQFDICHLNEAIKKSLGHHGLGETK